MQQNLDALSHQNILVALLVVLVGIWVLKQFMDFAITWRTLRKPQEKEAHDLTTHQQECEKKFTKDQGRLNDLEDRMDGVEEGQRVLCKGLYVVIEHMRHNGNEDEMKTASSNLFDFINS